MGKIRIALFDMAATTVDDNIQVPWLEGKLPLVISAYVNAFRKAGIEMPFDELNACRGRNKLEVFVEKVKKYKTKLSPEEQEKLAKELHDKEFVPALLENVQYLKEMPGTTSCFRYLKDNGIFIATGSGFPLIVTEAINRYLGWKTRGLVDFATCGESAGGGRPKPHMINQVLVTGGYLPKRINLGERQPHFDYSILMKVGDTEEDVKEGDSVGALNIAVSSGTQSIETLVKANPKVVLPSVAAVPHYLTNHRYL